MRLFRKGLEANVAVINLALVACALLVLRLTLACDPPPSGLVVSAAACAYIMVLILSFPVGWLSVLLAGGEIGSVFMVFVLACIFLPLNAYLWGYIAAVIVRRRAVRKHGDAKPTDSKGS